MEAEKRLNEQENAGTTQIELTRPPTNIFRNERGLRAGWRLLIYIFIVFAIAFALNYMVRHFVRPGLVFCPINNWS